VRPHCTWDLIQAELAGIRVELGRAKFWVPADLLAALRFIHAHLFDDRLTVGLLRSRFAAGNNNFSSRFRAHVRVSPSNYILHKRMHAAQRLLSVPALADVPVYEIGLAVGYNHPDSFCRAFRRYFGVTPSEWRLRKVATRRPTLLR
jgi:AraC-like DNA-binding protein